VAERVGVTEPVIFQNFGSKAALFAAVLERAATDARSSIDDFGSAADLLNHVLVGHAGASHGKGDHAGSSFGVLFADAVALTAEPELAGPAQDALQTVAAHLADLIRHAQATGAVHQDTDPAAAAWLLLSVLSARRLRDAAMPAGLEPAVTALALRALLLRQAGAKSSCRSIGARSIGSVDVYVRPVRLGDEVGIQTNCKTGATVEQVREQVRWTTAEHRVRWLTHFVAEYEGTVVGNVMFLSAGSYAVRGQDGLNLVPRTPR
jgi:AcrR family transcriptional regulator